MLTIDLSENKVLGPAYLRGREQGREEGRHGLLAVLRDQIAQRFESLPEPVDRKLSESSSEELETIGRRVLKATSFEDLFR